MHKDWFGDAKRQLRAGRLQQAYDAALQRLSTDREDGDAWGIMSLVALEGGNHAKSLELSDKALNFHSKSALVWGGRGKALLAASRQDEARELASQCAVSDCTDALEADTIGVILARTGLHREALAFFEYATSSTPRSAQFYYNLATSRQFVGDLPGAKAAYRTVLTIDRAFHRARLALVQLEKPDEHEPDKIAALFAEFSADPDAGLQLGHAAAKIHEASGDHDAVLDWLERAKRAKSASVSHDRLWVGQLFDAARAQAKSLDGEPVSPQEAACAPLFIVGMPRSGTTLVERILSSHSQIATAGELPDFALLVKRSGQTPGKHTLAPDVLAASFDEDAVGRAYLERTRALAGGHARLIDKMPFNFFFAPQILRSLPSARIVMVRRDPRDTVFANFRQLFATDFGYYDYAYDLDDTAHFVAQFAKYADELLNILPPDRYTEIHYETLIADQEAESRRLVQFIGLDWEEQCLQFHRNTAPVSTASSVQVRSPIHSKSVGQWERYGTRGELVNRKLREYGVI